MLTMEIQDPPESNQRQIQDPHRVRCPLIVVDGDERSRDTERRDGSFHLKKKHQLLSFWIRNSQGTPHSRAML
jgi:hypothetical protein